VIRSCAGPRVRPSALHGDEGFRTPGGGEKMALDENLFDENLFIEGA